MTTYRNGRDEGKSHILFGVSNVLYDVRLDGSTRSIHPACGDPITVTRNGRWAACNADAAGIALLDLTDTHAARPLPFLLTNDDGTFAGDPTWAPDGDHLAVFSQRWGGCAIEIYTVSLEDARASLAVVLPLPQFVGHGPAGNYCLLHGLTWSPDGARFAFHGETGSTPIYTLSLTAVWPLLSQKARSSYTSIQVTSDMLSVLSAGDAATTLAWGPTPTTLTYTSQYGDSIEQVDLATHVIHMLLTEHVASITRLSWTPDGTTLVFSLGKGGGPEFTPPPVQLYVYSPPS